MQKRAGFTLIEISIVLVIIGLIVGGILSGQTLIASAQKNRQIAEFRYLLTSIRMFQDKYGTLPGDYDQAEAIWPTTGDHAVENGNADGIFPTPSVEDRRNAWTMLYNAGYLDQFDYPWRASFLTSKTFRLPASYALYYLNIYNHPGNYIQWGTEDAVDPILTPEEGIWFDNKLDNGDMRTGKVFVSNGRGVGSWGCVSKPVWDATGKIAPDMTKTTPQCTLHFFLD